MKITVHHKINFRSHPVVWGSMDGSSRISTAELPYVCKRVYAREVFMLLDWSLQQPTKHLGRDMLMPYYRRKKGRKRKKASDSTYRSLLTMP